jgi:hypothetical protein
MIAKTVFMDHRWAIGMLALILFGCSKSVAIPKPENASRDGRAKSEESKPLLAGDRFFQNQDVKLLSLRFSESDSDLLQQDHRPYIRADFSNDTVTLYSVGAKLKGAAGSYQLLDGKPGFTIKFDKFRKKQTLDQLDKIHLNNSVQDGTYLCEWLGSEVFRLADYPAPRVAHALLKWNERTESMYVVREAFDKTFLRRFFSNSDGNLYDGGFLQDLDADLEKDSGLGVDDRSDLRDIVSALKNNNAAVRYREMQNRIDLDKFITFMALERMLCHWDGYSVNANNYRLYIDPDTGLAVFFPHGMDQLLGDPNMPLFDFPSSHVASQVMGNDKWRSRYRAKVKELLPLFDPPDNLIRRTDQIANVLREKLKELGDEPLQQFNEQVEDLKHRISDRANAIKEQLSQEEPLPLSLAAGESIALNDWYPACDHEGMAIHPKEDQTPAYLQLAITTEPGYASWRHHLILKRGTYRMEGRYRTEQIEPIDELTVESIGLGNSRDERWSKPGSDEEWQTFSDTFTIVEDRFSIELILGLRAKKGSMQIDRESFRLSRVN